MSDRRVTIVDAGAGLTQLVVRTTYPSAEALEQVLDMGMAEGMAAAVGQIDALLGVSG